MLNCVKKFLSSTKTKSWITLLRWWILEFFGRRHGVLLAVISGNLEKMVHKYPYSTVVKIVIEYNIN